MKISKTTVRNYEIYDCAKWQSTIGETLMFRQRADINSVLRKNRILALSRTIPINLYAGSVP